MRIRISKTTRIWIYGAGDTGLKCASALITCGCNVAGFIDAKKEGRFGTFLLNCYKLDKMDKELFNPNSEVVVVCIANGMIHSEIATSLDSIGFRYILYLPMNCPISKGKKRKITRTFNKVLIGDIDDKEVFDYEETSVPDYNKEDSIFDEEDDRVSVYMNSEILYVERFCEENKENFHGNMDLYDTPILSYRGYLQSFDFFATDTDELDHFWETFESEYNDEDSQKEIVNRNKLYSVYESEIDKGLGFFEDAAPAAERNDYGYYNLVGGHHRTMYLLSKGYRCIPVILSRNDYIKWFNRDCFEQMKSFNISNGVLRTIVPIPHPAFSAIPSLRERHGRTILEAVYNYLSDKGFVNCSVLDVSPFEGYFARALARKNQRASKVRIYSKERYDSIYHDSGFFINGYLERLFILIYTPGVSIERNSDTDEEGKKNNAEYDTVFMPGLILNSGNEKIIKSLMLSCRHFIFWESKSVEDVKFLHDSCGLYNTKCIHSEMIEGIKYDFCVSEI